MTTVEYTDTGEMLRFKADGHASFAESGRDLVCAAESILAYTLVQNLMDAKEKGWLEELDADTWDGGVLVEATPIKRFAPRVRTIFKTILTGYRLLEKNFPENVAIF